MNNPPLLNAAYAAATLSLFPPDERRNHLGASVIGERCSRKIWYKFRWAYDGQPHKPELLRLFRRGHREEPEFLRYLRAIPGVTVWDAGDAGEHKEALRISACDGHFGGTPDGIVHGLPDTPPDSYGLLEFKTMNDKSWTRTKEDGMAHAHPVYFAQVQIYMHFHELSYCAFFAVNKNDDRVHMEIVNYNPAVAMVNLAKAQDIINATTPPTRISDSPGDWECRFCDYVQLCHFDEIPSIHCRTCAYASPGPAGSWECSRNRPEIGNQQGCPEHIYDPRFWGDKIKFLDSGDNWIKVHDGVGVETWGPRHLTSQKLKGVGFIPF